MYRIFIITFVVFSFIFSGPIVAGNRQKEHQFDKKTFIEKRNAFLIEKIGLTSEETAKFIPLYNEFQDKKFDAGRRCREMSRKIKKSKNATAADYSHAVDECVEVKLKEAEIEKKYYGKFKKILSPEKLYKLTWAEYRFAREFMQSSGKRK